MRPDKFRSFHTGMEVKFPSCMNLPVRLLLQGFEDEQRDWQHGDEQSVKAQLVQLSISGSLDKLMPDTNVKNLNKQS